MKERFLGEFHNSDNPLCLWHVCKDKIHSASASVLAMPMSIMHCSKMQNQVGERREPMVWLLSGVLLRHERGRRLERWLSGKAFIIQL